VDFCWIAWERRVLRLSWAKETLAWSRIGYHGGSDFLTCVFLLEYGIHFDDGICQTTEIAIGCIVDPSTKIWSEIS
jgi:hypothetical protein